MATKGTKKRIYLDHASATPVLPAAARAMARAAAQFGNPGATHTEGAAAKAILQDARERIAAQLACKAREVVFTSGLTEANDLAILGLLRRLSVEGKNISKTHWLVSSIEHDAVLESFAEVERLGGKVTHVDPDAHGVIAPEAVVRALRPETVMVSVGWGNNEIGTVQPLRDISFAIRVHERKHGTLVAFHSDAGQAPLYLHPTVHSLGVDLFSFGSGKLYGPRGIGALYISNRVTLAPILLGGGQERGLRAGTEEPALAAGFAAAFELIAKERAREATRLRKLRDDFAGKIVAQFPSALLNTHLDRSMPHLLNVSVPNINAELVVLQLDRRGVAISTKSACNEGDAVSHVVASLGGHPPAGQWRARNTLRFSFGRATTTRDLQATMNALAVLLHEKGPASG